MENLRSFAIFILSIWAVLVTILYYTEVADPAQFDPTLRGAPSVIDEFIVEPLPEAAPPVQSEYASVMEVCSLIREAYAADQAGASEDEVRAELEVAHLRSKELAPSDSHVSYLVSTLIEAWDSFDIPTIDAASTALGELCGESTTI